MRAVSGLMPGEEAGQAICGVAELDDGDHGKDCGENHEPEHEGATALVTSSESPATSGIGTVR
jgi:hypothetical protein